MTEYTVGSLFTGIGGIDLAFERAGFTIKWQVEIDDYCNRVLEKHWPGVKRHRDVRTVGASNLSPVDICVGGFPCTNISVAGRGEGIKEGNASGLWCEFARIIGELRPGVVFIENVPAITTRGGTTVIAQLAALGYDAQWGIVAAADAGAPHRRERWFCVAHGENERVNGRGIFQRNNAPSSKQGIISSGGRSDTQLQTLADTLGDEPQRARRSGIMDGPTSGNQSPEEERQRVWNAAWSSRKDIQGVGQADAFGPRLEVGQGILGNGQQEPSSAERSGRDDLSDANGQSLGRLTVPWPQCGNRPIESVFCRVADELSAQLDRSGVVEHGPTEKRRSDQILRALRKPIVPKTVQRRARRQWRLQTQKILRSEVLGFGSEKAKTNPCRAQKTSGKVQGRRLRKMRNYTQPVCTSPRSRSIKQRAIKPHDLVQCLSYALALGTWQETVQRTVGLRHLREAIKGVRTVPKALSALQEVWRSMPDYEKEWCAVRACQGERLMWPAPPGQPQHPWEPPRTTQGSKNRTARLKALGNSVVPAVIAPFAVAIWQALEEEEALNG